MIAELHCHSIYSTGTKIIVEGFDKPKQIMKNAKKLGIQCVAITDHDTTKAHEEAKKYAKKYGILFIPGEEITTDKGHVLALGITEEIKPKLSLLETIDRIHKQGGIAIAPHPFDFRRKGIGEAAKYCDAIEIFNAINVERTANLRAKKLAEKLRKPITAGSDAHSIEMMGYGLTKIECSSLDSCIKAIKKGKTEIIVKYLPMEIFISWIVNRLKYSYYFVKNYISINYRWPKRVVASKLVKLVRYSPGKIDYLFRALGYIALGCVISYSFFRNMILRR